MKSNRVVPLALFLAAVLAGGPLAARAPMPTGQAPGYYRLMLGDFGVTALLDGSLALPVSRFLRGLAPAQIRRLLARDDLTDPLEIPIDAFLVNTGEQLVLIDTGLGAAEAGTGHLLENLRAAGYQAEQIDEIYITHFHGDHIGGLTREGQRAFPNARVRASRAEAEYWLDPKRRDAASGDLKETMENAQTALAPYVQAGRFSPFDGDAVLVPGIQAVATPGHTPGHTAYRIESRGSRLLVIGDLIHVGAVQFPHPAVTIQFDSDPAAARRQRLRIFREAARDHEWIAAAHLSFPGIGHIHAQGQGFRWVPVASR